MMKNRPLLGVFTLVAVALVVGVGRLLTPSIAGPQPRSSASPEPGPGASTPAGSIDEPLEATTHVDGVFDVVRTNEPTADSAQSKVWFAQNAWWATLIDPLTQELHIGRLDPATQTWSDTGTLVDARLHVRADALWDGTYLTIVTAGRKPSASQALRVSQFQFDPATGRYRPEPDLPISLTAAGVTTPVLVRDSAGVLWLSYVDGTKLIVRHTLGDVWHWSPAGAPQLSGADGAVRTAALTAGGKVVTLAWDGIADDSLHIAWHDDGADPESWAAASTPVAGLRDAPGGLSIRTAVTGGRNRLFVAFETAPDGTKSTSSLAPGAIVMIRDWDGTWSSAQLGRLKDHLTSPILMVDELHNTLIAAAFVRSSGAITYKRSSLDKVSFEVGSGADLMLSSTNPSLRNPTSTKQAVDLTAGVVVLGADDGTGHYAHGWLATSAPNPSARPSASAQPSPSVPPAGPTILLHDTFDPWAVGTRLPPGWVASPQGGGAGLVEVVGIPTKVHHSLLVRTTSAAGSIRACTSFAPTSTGTITVTELLELAGIGTSDTTIGAVRGPGGEAASVRVTRDHLLAYYDGTRKLTTSIALRTGVWYGSTTVIRLASHTYDWTVTNAAGRAIARVTGIRWREAAIPAVDTLCTQAAQGRGASILLDDTEVLR